MTIYRQNRLLDALQKAMKSNVTPTPSTTPDVCGICESQIAIGADVMLLPGPRKGTFTVCVDCFELYRLCPGPRPME